MSEKKWIFLDENIDEAIENAYCDIFKISHIVSKTLLNRGFTDAGNAKKFLEKDHKSLYSPMLLIDMDKAIDRIQKAINNNEKITVYGDYDVDGITSTALMVKYLRSQNVDANYYIPDRQNEGYGVNCTALEKIKNDGTSLIITVDSGITALEEAKYAKSLGLDLIITDHHECKEGLPEAIAVINPKRLDSKYPFKELAGVGVAFKLVSALSKKSDVELLSEYSDIIMLGTIADVVPLFDENRIIAGAGLEKFYNNPNIGLESILNVIGANKKWNASAVVSYSIAPHLNAAGRMSNASVAVELLLTTDIASANEYAMELKTFNKERQSVENEIFKDAEEMLKDKKYEDKEVLVLAKKDWHHGIIGIVASRICDKYNKSCILISVDDDVCKSSGRSVDGFNLFDALSSCSDVLEKFGGHAYAAGCSVKEKNIEEFDRRINEYAKNNMDATKTSDLYIDARVEPSELTLQTVKSIEVLAPYGASNQMPTVAILNGRIEQIRTLSDGKHARILLEKDGSTVEIIAFGSGELADRYYPGDIIDVAGDLNINVYNGESLVQLILKDIRFSPDAQLNNVPDREDFVSVYNYIKKNGQTQSFLTEEILEKLSFENQKGFPKNKLINVLSVFEDVGILSFRNDGETLQISLNDVKKGQKVDLVKSKIYSNIKNNFGM